MYAKHAVLIGLIMIPWWPSAPQGEELGLTRQDAIRIALETNSEVVAALAVSEAAKARAVQAGAIPNLQLDLEYEELPRLIDIGTFGERTLGATQAIEFPLKWWWRRRAAQLAAHATQLLVVEVIRQEISLRVKKAYDRVLFSEERLEFNRENLKVIQGFLTKVQLRREAGDVPALDVIRAEVEVGRSVNRLTQVQSDLDDARATLNTLLGRDLKTPFRLTANLDYQPSSQNLSVLEKLAFRRRPEIRGTAFAFASARSQQGATRASLFPDLSIGVFRQMIVASPGTESFWRVGFGLELPLWGGVGQRGELAEAKATTAQAAAEQIGARQQVLLDVERASLRLKYTEEQVQLFEGKIMAAAERAFEVASRSYREGKAIYLDVLEAQRALIEVREEYTTALFHHRATFAQLEWATGGELPYE